MKQKDLFYLILLILLTVFGVEPALELYKQNNTPVKQLVADDRSFDKSKRLLHEVVFVDNLMFDYYCGCSYTTSKEIRDDCGYNTLKDSQRARRIEWEHIVPASHYGQHLKCWKEGGRKNCGKDKAFNNFEGDMHNLRPVNGEVNQYRSDKYYNTVPYSLFKFGQCNFKISKTWAEPPDRIKGDVARITLYIYDKYGLYLPDELKLLYTKWHEQDPATNIEKAINKSIKDIQGDSNPYLE